MGKVCSISTHNNRSWPIYCHLDRTSLANDPYSHKLSCLPYPCSTTHNRTFLFHEYTLYSLLMPLSSASEQARAVTRTHGNCLVFLVVFYNSTHNIRNFFVMNIRCGHCWCTCLSGPSLFFSCPMDFKAAEGWFVNVWNYNVIPYLHQALRSGRKVHYQALFILCSILVPFSVKRELLLWSPRLIKFTSVTFVFEEA